jgi:hypothetical protein
MTIEVPAAEVYALAAAVRSMADVAVEAVRLLGESRPVHGPLQPAVEGFLECHRTASCALAGELDWLGRTVASVADSWLRLDGSLLTPRGQVGRR